MIDGLPTMAQAKRYEEKTKDMSPEGKAIFDEMLARCSPDSCCQGVVSVSLYDLRDICERIARRTSTPAKP